MNSQADRKKYVDPDQRASSEASLSGPTLFFKKCLSWLSRRRISFKQFEPRHEISNNVVGVTSKGSDQPAHTRSLIRAFARRLDIL